MKIQVGIPVFIAAAGTDPRFARLVHRYLFSATIWLLLAGFIGLFLSFRLVDPDLLGAYEFLFHGRLRPVHVLTMLAGWASLALVALAFYVVSKSSRVTMSTGELLTSNIALVLWNLGVLAGVLAIPFGHTTGREYREYPLWCVAPIAVALVLLFGTFYHMVARRAVKGVYISSWFVLAACFWLLVVVVIGNMPFFRRGLSNTIISGYYIHNFVGMWFTPLAVGLTYYTLPKLLNKPIYSYALGVLGFFTHLVFYTLIGTHHFIYSPLPDWLETTAVVFSVAMIVPVWASTGNFLMTMRGERTAIRLSYSLPFIFAGVIAYGLASMQGSAESLRKVQEQWHLTHYTVGHAHAAMYGFVSFLIWGSLYGLVPRITGREPPVALVSLHFWLALAGLLIYALALWLAGDTQGAAWVKGLPFMESVRQVIPYMVWRAVGGMFMMAAHIVFAINLVKMRPGAFTMAFEQKAA
ncbi:MAG: cbb3-type cytochrome c oxidase subunit I [Planctomycetota bacterium]